MDLKEITLDLEAVEQVADMLWLSEYIEKSKVEEVSNENKLLETPSDIPETPKKTIQKERKKRKEEERREEQVEEASVYSPDDIHSTQTDIKADPIKMPKKLSLSNYRAWEKSFRTFYHKVDSRWEFVLDEEKTVEVSAKTKLIQPIFKAKRVKYFHLIMVIEQSPSMDIWKELLLEFQKSVQRFGVFEGIDFYYLSSNKQGVKLYRDKALKRELSHKKLNLNNQTLLTVVSDCVSSGWHSNHIFQMLAFWSKSVSVSITHMFPKRMWQGTALYKGFQTSFTAYGFQPLNMQLSSDDNYYDDEDELFKIPIINFEPQSINAWGLVIQAKKGKWIDGIVLEEFEELEFKDISTNKREVTSEQRIQRYLSQASPLAQKLALYASVLPINFHVIRILQELKLPESTQVHLAEFFLGGLIKREVDEDKKVSFDFHDGVRDHFRNQLTATAAYKLQESMTSFVSEHLNSSLDFQALIDNPNSTSGLYLSKDEVEFVKLRADTLRKLGGEYGKRANSLMKHIVLEQGDDKTVKRLKEEFLKNFMPLDTLKGREIEEYSRIFNYSFGLLSRLARSFSKSYTHEMLKEIEKDIVEVYGEIAWVKKLEKNRILWVDDRPHGIKKIKDTIETIGLVVDMAKSTDEALKLIKQNTYLLIISDLRTRAGQTEGYVLLEKLRSFDNETPFILFTRLDSLEVKKMVIEKGGQGSTRNDTKLCRMVMNLLEDGSVDGEAAEKKDNDFDKQVKKFKKKLFEGLSSIFSNLDTEQSDLAVFSREQVNIKSTLEKLENRIEEIQKVLVKTINSIRNVPYMLTEESLTIKAEIELGIGILNSESLFITKGDERTDLKVRLVFEIPN